MKYLVFSDIHGNLEAYQALQKFLQKKHIDHYLYLGDLVGYGASPNEVIQKIRALEPLTILRGNHDKAVCAEELVETFNPIAAAAIAWCQKTIRKPNLQFLCDLPKGPVLIGDRITLCHGTPFDEDYYIFGEFDAAEAFGYLKTPIGFFGHTHFPYVYIKDNHVVRGIFPQGDYRAIKLKKSAQYLINPGSIGQPRDRNPKASCAIFDSQAGTVKFYRFGYDLAKAQKRILTANLPPGLAERLSLGI